MNVHELAHASWMAYVDPANRGSVDTMEMGKMAEKERQDSVERALTAWVEKAARALGEFDGRDTDAPAPEGEYEELTPHVLRMASTGHTGSIAEWSDFLAALRTVLRERDEARQALGIANRDGLDLLYAIRSAVGWTDKHSLSLLPDECARLKKAAEKNAPIWPGAGYDHSNSGGFDGPTGAN